MSLEPRSSRHVSRSAQAIGIHAARPAKSPRDRRLQAREMGSAPSSPSQSAQNSPGSNSKISPFRTQRGFAAKSLAVIRKARLEGGGFFSLLSSWVSDALISTEALIALGHPLGARAKSRHPPPRSATPPSRTGMVDECVVGGMGAAGILTRWVEARFVKREHLKPE